MLREHIQAIHIPQKGPALLEADPAGLLSSLHLRIFGDPEGSRTPVSRVRVWCPRPLNDGVTQSGRKIAKTEDMSRTSGLRECQSQTGRHTVSTPRWHDRGGLGSASIRRA